MMNQPRRTIFRSNSRDKPTSSKGSRSGSGSGSRSGSPSESSVRSTSMENRGPSFHAQQDIPHIQDQGSPTSGGRRNSASLVNVGVLSPMDLGDDVEEDGVGDEISEEEEFNEECNIIPIVGGYSSDSSDAEKVDAQNRKRLRPRGKTFKDSREVMKVVTTIMHSHYEGPWTCWTKVPQDVKRFWWKQFEKVYFWKDRHAHMVRTNWQRKCSQHLRSSFKDGRPVKKKPRFVSQDDWAALLVIWENDEAFQKLSETNRQNRASEGHFGKGTYTGGSKSSVQHAAEFKDREKSKMTQEELMKVTFRKKNQGMDWLCTQKHH